MTRSTLLRTVQRVAGVAAGSRSLSAESRRHFLVAGGALALAAATGRTNAASRRKQPKVAIVGAGLAGLAAAHTLRKAGLHATVIEGSTRIGGRCWSEREAFTDGQVAERGGEFVDSVHEELIALVRELHLELDDVVEATPVGTDTYTLLDGTRYTVAEATHDYEALFPVVQKQAKALGDAYGYVGSNRAARSLDAISMAQWIDKYVPGGRTSRFGRLLANAFAEEFAVEVGQLSAINLVLALAPSPRNAFAAYAASDQRYHVRGGNDQVAHRMAGLLQAPLETGKALIAAQRMPDGRCKLILQHDLAIEEAVYDRVIIAIPFATLGQVDLAKSGFRPLKRRAIHALPMGASTKLQLQFDRRHWNALGSNGEVRLEGSFHSTWDVTRGQPGTPGILNCWSGGRVAVAAGERSKEDQAELALDDLETAWPGIRERWNGRVIRNAWHTNPWSGGSYVYYPPGYMTTLLGVEAEREGNYFFAGEHTSRDWQGFLNGAVESGMRAAREVLRSLR
ncbi:MAG: FAD-dependent oxidoreductase [Burkholderiales bacterium]|nr:FAD-dependent oxidoreductase [Burkholderiales bacterium]